MICLHYLIMLSFLCATILFFFTGRGGMAVTMVTQFDVKNVKNIEKHISKFPGYPMSKIVLKVLLLIKCQH